MLMHTPPTQCDSKKCRHHRHDPCPVHLVPKAGCTSLQDSAHFKNEQRKQAQVDAKIAKLKQQASELTQAELAGLSQSLQQRIACLEASRDLSRTWIHGALW